MAQTIRKQSDLLSNLADNNNKSITPEDVRDVVASTNGPIMIWAGKLRPYEQGGNKYSSNYFYESVLF